jgi:hypothetical protein
MQCRKGTGEKSPRKERMDMKESPGKGPERYCRGRNSRLIKDEVRSSQQQAKKELKERQRRQ